MGYLHHLPDAPHTPPFPRRRAWGALLLWGALLALLVGSAWVVGPAGRAGAATEIIVEPAPTHPRCANGDIVGTTPACPFYTVPGGPTPTADPFRVVALAGDGRQFSVERGWSYGDVLNASILLTLLGVCGFYIVHRTIRG